MEGLFSMGPTPSSLYIEIVFKLVKMIKMFIFDVKVYIFYCNAFNVLISYNLSTVNIVFFYIFNACSV